MRTAICVMPHRQSLATNHGFWWQVRQQHSKELFIWGQPVRELNCRSLWGTVAIWLSLTSLTFVQQPELHRYKGNTPTHTINSDGGSAPDTVARWCREHGDRNGHRHSNNLGGDNGAGDVRRLAEGFWDTLLSRGKRIGGE
jgi:hypothetical protein